MKRKLAQTIFARAVVALASVAVIRVRATPSSGLVNIPLARGTNVSNGTIPFKAERM